MRHGPMDWTVGTQGTLGIDALTRGTGWGRLDAGDRLARRWGEDSRTHEAWSHGLDRGDARDAGE